MKYCKHCGSAAEDSDKFCPNCGTQFVGNEQPTVTKLVCKKCGQELKAEDSFCPSCGAPTDRQSYSPGYKPVPNYAYAPPKKMQVWEEENNKKYHILLALAFVNWFVIFIFPIYTTSWLGDIVTIWTLLSERVNTNGSGVLIFLLFLTPGFLLFSGAIGHSKITCVIASIVGILIFAYFHFTFFRSANDILSIFGLGNNGITSPLISLVLFIISIIFSLRIEKIEV